MWVLSPRLPRRTFVLCLLAFPARGEDGFTLDTLMARMAAAGPRRARFAETRRFAALDGTLDSRGWLAFEGGRLLKVTEWPQPERLDVEGDRVVITAGNEPPRVIEMSMAPALRVLIDAVRGPLAGDAGALRRGFRVSLSGSFESWTLDLAPLAAGVLRSVRLEGSRDVVGRIAMAQSNGDEQVMVISPP